MHSSRLLQIGAACAILFAATAASSAQLRADFTDGTSGWQGIVGSDGTGTVIGPAVGVPAPALHSTLFNTGIEFSNTDAAWLDVVRTASRFEFGLGALATHITGVESGERTRPLILEIRTHMLTSGTEPFSSVWTTLGVLDPLHPKWRRMVAQMPDTRAADIPDGWSGSGAEDPATGKTILPPGVTFADVMANADEIVVTTLQPGYIYDFSYFDVTLDQITLRYPKTK